MVASIATMEPVCWPRIWALATSRGSSTAVTLSAYSSIVGGWSGTLDMPNPGVSTPMAVIPRATSKG